MKCKQIKGNEISGELDIFIAQNDDEDGETIRREDILIHGNPVGLKSFAKLPIEIAELNQEKVSDKYLPVGAREHYHLRPGIEQHYPALVSITISESMLFCFCSEKYRYKESFKFGIKSAFSLPRTL